MRYISATESKQRFASVIDAAQREPVTIRRRNRDVAVMMSAEQFQQLSGENVAAFEAFCDQIGERARQQGLNEGKLQAMLADAE